MNVRTTPIQDSTALKLAISKQWAKQPPAFTINKPIAELLGTVDVTFPLVDPHEYFQEKYHPFSAQALKSGDEAVLKRGTFLKDCHGLIGLFVCVRVMYNAFLSNLLSRYIARILYYIAVRKMKFFLHPDKTPKTFNEQQSLLCKTLWDVTAEAWEAHGGN